MSYKIERFGRRWVIMKNTGEGWVAWQGFFASRIMASVFLFQQTGRIV